MPTKRYRKNRRFRYGTSAGPLARRHGARLAPVVLPPGPLLPGLVLLAGRPRLAAVVLGVQGARLGRRLARSGAPAILGPAWAARAAWQTADGASRAVTMLLPAPLLATAALRRSARRRPAASAGTRARRSCSGSVLARVALLGAATATVRWSAARADGRTGGLGPVRWCLAEAVDDAAYGSGVWVGALRARAPRALVPVRRSSAVRTPARAASVDEPTGGDGADGPEAT